MVTITAPVTVPNITRWKVARFVPADDVGIASIVIDILSPVAGGRSRQLTVVARNAGASDVLQKKAAPTRWDDDVEVVQSAITVANAYDTIEAAYRGAATKAAAYRAVETQLLALGLVHAALTGAVSS